MLAWGVLAYVAVGTAAALAASLWLERPLLTLAEPWLNLGDWLSILYSALLGMTLAVVIILASRVAVRRYAWGRRLHDDLRAVARQLGPGEIAVLALCSGITEELVFRGLLQPEVGLLPQAILFGLVHQMRGPSRWVWVGWAGVVGLLLGLIFQLTGALLGPLLAHVLINYQNLNYLKHHTSQPAAVPLRGLLRRGDS